MGYKDRHSFQGHSFYILHVIYITCQIKSKYIVVALTQFMRWCVLEEMSWISELFAISKQLRRGKGQGTSKLEKWYEKQRLGVWEWKACTGVGNCWDVPQDAISQKPLISNHMTCNPTLVTLFKSYFLCLAYCCLKYICGSWVTVITPVYGY